MAAVATQQFGQEFFVNRHLTVAQRSQFLLVIVDQDDVMTEVGKARPATNPTYPEPTTAILMIKLP